MQIHNLNASAAFSADTTEPSSHGRLWASIDHASLAIGPPARAYVNVSAGREGGGSAWFYLSAVDLRAFAEVCVAAASLIDTQAKAVVS